MNVFPFTLHCNGKGWSEHRYRDFFLSAKPAGLSWFGYDTILHSRTDIEFVVYDMKDSFYGGLGSVVCRFRSVVPPAVTKEHVEQRIFLLAAERREKELADEEAAIVRRYASEIRRSLPRQNKKRRALLAKHGGASTDGSE